MLDPSGCVPKLRRTACEDKGAPPLARSGHAQIEGLKCKLCSRYAPINSYLLCNATFACLSGRNLVVSTLIARIVERFNAWRERERAFAELNALDDRTLADLGLRRSDIPYVIYGRPEQRATPVTTAAQIAGAANGNSGLRAA
jgi:uncharacterized protein YjiS (DUF1127 family)